MKKFAIQSLVWLVLLGFLASYFPSFLQWAAAFIAMLLIVVTIHEGGHYLAARYYGVHVLRFCVGFGKPFFLRTDKRGTEWAIAPLPLGGYVQMLDLKTAERSGIDPARALESQNNWRSFVIYGAGPLANLILSAVIMTGVFYGERVGARAQFDWVHADTPAERAGMVEGEIIQNVGGAETPFWPDVSAALLDAALSGGAFEVHTDGNYYSIPAGEMTATDVEEGILRSFGVRRDRNYLTTKLEQIIAESPAERAGILAGDEIHAIDGYTLLGWSDLAAIAASSPGATLTMQIWREDAGEAMQIPVTLDILEEDGERYGFLGVRPTFNQAEYDSRLVTVQTGLFDAAAQGMQRVGEDVMRTLRFIEHMFFGELSVRKNVGGPITIARTAGAASEFGLVAWWGLVALISISLAVINLFPLPILDGGRMLICIAQALRRRNFSQETIAVLDRAGAVMVVCLMVFVIVIDIMRL